MTYAPARIREEVAYVAYHFHWSHDEILDLEHPQLAIVARAAQRQQAPVGSGVP